MTKVYVVQHEHVLEDGFEDVKLIGVYSSRENAQAAITRLNQIPGFSDTLDGFHIDEYQLDKDHWVERYWRSQALEVSLRLMAWQPSPLTVAAPELSTIQHLISGRHVNFSVPILLPIAIPPIQQSA